MRDSGLRSTGPNLAKSTFGHGSRSMPPTPPPAARPLAAAARPARAPPLAKASTSSRMMRPWSPRALDLAEVDAELARELAHRRAGVGEREGRLRRSAPAAGGAAGAALRRRRRPRPRPAPARRRRRSASHRRWRAPGSTDAFADLVADLDLRSSRTTPPSGAGTSIVALSDSSETSGSSAFTVSPALTKISMTGTSLKSPMSGTRTSATPAGRAHRRRRRARRWAWPPRPAPARQPRAVGRRAA